MKKTVVLLLALSVLLCAAAGAESPLRVVATNFPCYDFARAVSGGEAEVTMLLKPGTEAHSYDPTPADILAIEGADLFVYIGGESDAWANGILESLDADRRPVTLRMMDCVGDLIEEDEEEGHVHDRNEGPEYDEHIWTSPRNAAAMVRALGEVLADIGGGEASAYLEAADAYAAQIDALDGEIRQLVDGASRNTLVFADRFPFVYFTREYGLDYVAAFSSCTADAEPTPQILLTLIQKVVEDHIPAVYTIELSTQAIARTVAEETGAKILTLHSMQTVSQETFDAGETYVSLMRNNVEALVEGLL